jgi:hypothetical protein
MSGFMGLAVMLSYGNFERECITIGFERMRGSHNAENIKATIESILNIYDFDVKIIIGK